MVRLAGVGDRLRRLLGRPWGGRSATGAIEPGTSGARAGDDPCSSRAATIVPVPQPHAWFHALHAEQMAALAAAGDRDVLLIGDSLAKLWPLDLWAPWRAFSLGVGDDCTQHVLWRLERCAWGTCRPKRVLVVVGTNNLLQGDRAADVAAGVEAVAAAVARAPAGVVPFVLMAPPFGVGTPAQAEEREALRPLLRARLGHRLIDAEATLVADKRDPDPNYADDRIHLSRRGYEVLTEVVRAALG